MTPGPGVSGKLLRRWALRLPVPAHQALRRAYYAGQIRRGSFEVDDGEIRALRRHVSEGSWVLDVGANIGRYTLAFSNMVAAGGRVVAFEPESRAFELLASNVRRFPHANVTLVNCAASSSTGTAGMELPSSEDETEDLYLARLRPGATDLTVMTLAVDALGIPGPVALVKVDVEGHELPVLQGMRGLLERERPLVLSEGGHRRVAAFMVGLGFRESRFPGSPNRLFHHPYAHSAVDPAFRPEHS